MKKTSTSLSRRVHQARTPLTAIAALVLCGLGTSPSAAAPTKLENTLKAGETQGAAPAAASGARKTVVSLRQLGAAYPLKLQGIQSTAGVSFSVRSDEVVTDAKLRLNYSYSPALIPRLSHIKVLVNEQLADTIAVTPEQGGMSLQRDIDIPARLITEFNRLNLELIGHYTMECEDPAHTSLWANIGNDADAAKPISTWARPAVATGSTIFRLRFRTHSPPNAKPRMKAVSISSNECTVVPSA